MIIAAVDQSRLVGGVERSGSSAAPLGGPDGGEEVVDLLAQLGGLLRERVDRGEHAGRAAAPIQSWARRAVD